MQTWFDFCIYSRKTAKITKTPRFHLEYQGKNTVFISFMFYQKGSFYASHNRFLPGCVRFNYLASFVLRHWCEKKKAADDSTAQVTVRIVKLSDQTFKLFLRDLLIRNLFPAKTATIPSTVTRRSYLHPLKKQHAPSDMIARTATARSAIISRLTLTLLFITVFPPDCIPSSFNE